VAKAAFWLVPRIRQTEEATMKAPKVMRPAKAHADQESLGLVGGNEGRAHDVKEPGQGGREGEPAWQDRGPPDHGRGADGG
jgi:hypothetical protein